MDKKYMCPMMCGMGMMDNAEPVISGPELPIHVGMEIENYFQDEEDDRQFMRLHSEDCKRMMPYIRGELDKLEEKGEMLQEEPIDREMVSNMTDNAYRAMIEEMPEMAEEEASRQYPRRRFVRDLLSVLLLDELFRRRRRRRRRHYDYNPDYGYGYDEDFYDYY